MHLAHQVYGSAIALALIFPTLTTAQAIELAQAPAREAEESRSESIDGTLGADDAVLDGGEYYEIYTFEGTEGQVIAIDLVSEEFDTYLVVFGPDGERLAENDDGDDSNARIWLTLPSTGTYTVWATSYGVGEVGSYQLSWQEDIAFADALAELQQALDEAREGGDREAEYSVLKDIADLYDEQEQYLEAADYYQRSAETALLLLEEVEGEEEIAAANDKAATGYLRASQTYMNHSDVYEEQGRFQDSIEFLKKSVELAAASQPYTLASSDQELEVWALVIKADGHIGLGQTYTLLREYEAGLPELREALALVQSVSFDEIPDLRQLVKFKEWTALSGIQSIYHELTNQYRSAGEFESALAAAKERADHVVKKLALIQTELSSELTAEDRVDWERAKQSSLKALWGSLLDFGEIYHDWGKQLRESEDYEQALSVLQEGLGFYEAMLNLTEARLNSELPSELQTEWEETKRVSILSLITIYSEIAGVYEDQYDYEKSLEVHLQRLEIAKQAEDSELTANILFIISGIYNSMSRYPEALETGQQMLAVSQEINNYKLTLIALYFIGAVYDTTGDFSAALDAYQEALEIAQQEGSFVDEIRLHNNIGSTYRSQGQYERALESFDWAISMARELQELSASNDSIEKFDSYCTDFDAVQKVADFHERGLSGINSDNSRVSSEVEAIMTGWVEESQAEGLEMLRESMQVSCLTSAIDSEASTLNNMAGIYANQGSYREAIERYEESLALSQLLEDENSEANTLNNIGTVYSSQGDYGAALAEFQNALEAFKTTNNQPGVWQSLSNIGSIYMNQGDYEQAISYLQDALEIVDEIGLLPSKPHTLGQIGTAYFYQSKYEKATQFSQNALELSRQMGLLDDEAVQLHNLAVVASSQGNYAESIDYIQQAIALYEQMNAVPKRADALIMLGQTYRIQGNYAEAIAFQEEALAITQDIGALDSEGYALRSLADTYVDLGQYDRALDFNRDALDIFEGNGARASQADVLSGLGEAHAAQRDFEQALQAFERSLAIQQDIGDLSGQSLDLRNIGYVYTQQGNHSAARDSFEQALTIQREIGARGSQGLTLNGLGLAQQGLGDTDAAIASLQQALALHEELGDRPGQAKALSDLGGIYLQANRLTEAETTLYEAIAQLETLRASELQDTDKIALFDTQLAAYDTLQRVLVAQNDPAKALAALEVAERGRARAFVESLTVRLGDRADLEIDIASPNLDQMRQTAQQQNATLVEYSIVGADDAPELYIWVIAPTGDITFRQQSLAGIELADLVIEARAAIGVRGDRQAPIPTYFDEYLAQARAERQATQSAKLSQLYDLLIAPIADVLPTNPEQRVILIPQGDLFLVPFAALMNADGNYLIEQHTLLTAPSIHVLDLTRQQRQQRAATENEAPLIVGNPAMPTVQIPSADWTGRLTNLPWAEVEATKIADFFGTEAITGNAATESRLKQQMMRPGVLHFATHGLLEYGFPDESGVRDLPGAIALTSGNGEDGLLTAAEIYGMNLNADLVVLSACDTGRGRITGDGVVGLSRAFISAGAPSVVVSLWAVPDASTAELMVAFYNQLDQGQDKAQALRQAMLTTMQQYPDDPKHWAAFTLIGEAD